VKRGRKATGLYEIAGLPGIRQRGVYYLLQGDLRMKRSIFCIMVLMVVLLGTQYSSEAVTLTYLSGGMSVYTLIDEDYNSQSDPNYAHLSDQFDGICSADSSASAGGTGSLYQVNLSSSVHCLQSNYAFTQAWSVASFSFQVVASPGDSSNSGQITYYYDYNIYNYLDRGWDSSDANSPMPLVIYVNGATMIQKSPLSPSEYGSGSLNVNVGDIVKLSCSIFVDNVTPGGSFSSGGLDRSIYAYLSTPMTPVPLPSALLLLGAGLFRLANYGRRKRASRS
jgi:hypothetical protein